MEGPTARWRGGRQADHPAEGRQAPPANIKAEVPPHLHLQQTTSIEGKKERRGVREGVATSYVEAMVLGA